MSTMALPSFITLISFFISSATAVRPFQITWSSSTFGPDGPWQAVSVAVGTPPQKISLYPGGVFQSHLLTLDVCKNTTVSPICYATAAGIYDPPSSSTSLDDIIKFPSLTDFTEQALLVQGVPGIGALDSMDIGQGVTVSNVTLDIHKDIAVVYPDGTPYPIQLGTLALGFTHTVNQSFSGGAGGSSINGAMIPGVLSTSTASGNELTPSNSFGLHIGSVTPKVSGSLYFGGYDSLRIVGPISTQNGHPDTIDLIDISLSVIDGSSPWDSAAPLTGLLQAGNSTIGPALPVMVLPQAPYLNLPSSSCSAIAALLPVTYSARLGLYLWNTSTPAYSRIVSSASALSFTFRRDMLNTQNLTIHVPFSLLNLTLTPPIVSAPTPYFPCNAASRGHYSLGRAFLQAAFFGVNWDAPNNNAVWWLAQAAGPGAVTQTSVKNIAINDTSITASGNAWKESWKGFWTPLSAAQVSDPITPTTVVPTTPATPTAPAITASQAASAAGGGLGTGAIAGIAIGGAAVLLFLSAGVFFFLRRRTRQNPDNRRSGFVPGETAENSGQPFAGMGLQEKGSGQKYPDGGYGPAEVGDAAYYSHELGTGGREDVIHHVVHELPTRE